MRAWRADLASAAFGKITAVYGQINENGSSVRKWLARKMPFTDKMVKNGRLSVKIQLFRTRFYGQMLQKAGLSVKCVLLTDKSAKKGTLSVNLSEISAESVEQHCI
ncbi:MAG: hypothetical protein ACIRZM_06570 [Ligilactobacillus ruminis]